MVYSLRALLMGMVWFASCATAAETSINSSASPSNKGHNKAYSDATPIAERPSTLPHGYWSVGMLAGTTIGESTAPNNLALLATVPLSNTFQISGTLNSSNNGARVVHQSADITLLYSLLRSGPWNSMLSASYNQGVARPYAAEMPAFSTSGTLTYQLHQGPWYLFVTQLLRYTVKGTEPAYQVTTSTLGGRQITNKLWVNVGWSLFDYSSNNYATRTLLDAQPLYVNGVWGVTDTTDLSGSIGYTNLPLSRNQLTMMLGINVRNRV